MSDAVIIDGIEYVRADMLRLWKPFDINNVITNLTNLMPTLVLYKGIRKEPFVIANSGDYEDWKDDFRKNPSDFEMRTLLDIEL